jgi:hypothetical protein
LLKVQTKTVAKLAAQLQICGVSAQPISTLIATVAMQYQNWACINQHVNVTCVAMSITQESVPAFHHLLYLLWLSLTVSDGVACSCMKLQNTSVECCTAALWHIKLMDSLTGDR